MPLRTHLGPALACALVVLAGSTSASPRGGGASSLTPSPARTTMEAPEVGCELQLYCEGKKDSEGCLPLLSYVGCPNASWGKEFFVSASNLLGTQATVGMLFYSLRGPASIPFGGGKLCIEPAFKRTQPVVSLGQGTPCSGAFTFDFNVYIASGADPDLKPGQPVWMQYWYRDPNATDQNEIGLSRGLAGQVGI